MATLPTLHVVPLLVLLRRSGGCRNVPAARMERLAVPGGAASREMSVKSL